VEPAGRLERIWIKRAKLGPMDPAEGAVLRAGRGLAGNANQGGRRQVTILSQDRWDAITTHLPSPDPIVRRANLLVRGIDLTASLGKILRIGDCRIRVLGETRPCERMDEACPGLRAALGVPWGGGAFGEVLDDGAIGVGDRVRWQTS
jgi:MOSC domain-containing protein YiiM